MTESTLSNYFPGEDVGTLEIALRHRDDDATIIVTNERVLISVPLFAHEARKMIEVLTPLANEPDAE